MLIVCCLLSFFSLMGMENDNNVQPVPAIHSVPSLYDIALKKVVKYGIERKISREQIARLPKDMVEYNIEFLTPTVTKRYLFSTLTPDHQFMLGYEDDNYFLWNVDAKEEMPIDLLSKEHNKPLLVALSPSSELVVCFSSRKIWIKDIKNKSIRAERDSISPFFKEITFVGEKAILGEDQNDHLHHYFIKDNEIIEGPLSTFRYLGVLQKAAEFLVLNGSCVMKSDNGREYSGVTSIDAISELKPAIYEPDMLMAYELKNFSGFIKIISLKGNQLAPLGKLITASNVTALSFMARGTCLMVASIDMMKQIPQIAIYNWKSEDRLYTYEPESVIRINAISYTDDVGSKYPCIFETYDTHHSTCLYGFDPKKAMLGALLPKVPSNNNNSTKDTNKN